MRYMTISYEALYSILDKRIERLERKLERMIANPGPRMTKPYLRQLEVKAQIEELKRLKRWIQDNNRKPKVEGRLTDQDVLDMGGNCPASTLDALHEKEGD